MSNYRGANTTLIKEVTSLSQRVYELVSLTVFDITLNQDYTSYFTNAPFPITVGGHTYRAIGGMLGFSDVEEHSDFTISQVTVSLNGLASKDVALFLGANYTDRPLKIYRVWLDTSNQVVSDPMLIFDGRIDKPIINDDGKSATIGCTASSHWADYDRRAGRHTNFDEQQYWFPGDKGFEFVSVNTKDLKWGSK